MAAICRLTICIVEFSMENHPDPAQNSAAQPKNWRGPETVLTYFAFLVGAWAINGMGAILLPMQSEFQVSRSEVSFYPLLYSSGLILAGLFGAPILRRLGQQRAVELAMLLSLVAGLMLWIPSREVIAVAVIIFGSGSALISLVMPVKLHDLHGHRAMRAVTEANAVGSIGAIIAPLIVAAALLMQLDWRFGYLLPLNLLAAVILIAVLRRRAAQAEARAQANAVTSGAAAAAAGPDDAAPGTAAEAPPARESVPLGQVLGRWADVTLAVGVEFAFVFWVAAAMLDWHQVEGALATATGAAFLVGMAVGRTFGGGFMESHAPRTILVAGTVIALVGFAGFWAIPNLWASAAGLLIAGLGVAVMFPASISRLIAADPTNRERSSQLGALGVGLAIALAPVVLAFLGDLVGMRVAYLAVPLMLVIVLLKNFRDGIGDSPFLAATKANS